MDLKDELYKELLNKIEYLCESCKKNNLEDSNMYKIYEDLDKRCSDSIGKRYEECKLFLENNLDLCEEVESLLNKINIDSGYKDLIDKKEKLNYATTIVQKYLIECCDNYEFSHTENISKENIDDGVIYYFDNNRDIDCDKYKTVIQSGFISIYFIVQDIYIN